MIPMTLAEIAGVVGGRLSAADPDTVVTSVVADHRDVVPGCMFAAIQGQRVDGHDFIPAARDSGAVVALTSRPVGSAAIVVDDPVLALGRLASYVIRRLPDTLVMALTGSSGKTTTKDMLGALMATRGVTVSPRGSFNSEVGLPLTVLSCTTRTSYLVLEMGMRGHGHIAYLCGIAHPRIAGLINVGSAHLELLGSREAIADAKGEILDDLPPDGVAVLHADNPLVMAQASRSAAPILTFGESPEADVRACDISIDELARPSFTLSHGGVQREVRLRLSGAHQVSNALAAAALALAAGLDLEVIAATLCDYQPVSRWRMEVSQRADGLVVVNDAYNANPESMRAALEALASMGQAAGSSTRTWAVLGEMREIGDASVGEHRSIGALAVDLGIDRIVAVGDGARPIFEAAEGSPVDWVPDAHAAIALLDAELAPGDIVLVKASRSIGLDAVAEALLSEVPEASGGAA